MAKPCIKKIAQHPLSGTLDGHTPWGNAPHTDYRVVLNTSMPQEDKFSRRPGWQGLMRDEPTFLGEKGSRGNRDLHSQLLGMADNTITMPRREAVNLHFQYRSDCLSYGFIACTRSRIYTDTGAAANWRILADNLGPFDQQSYSGVGTDKYPAFGSTRMMAAQLGNIVLFTNDYNPVLGWRIGDPPEPLNGTDTACLKAQAAHPVQQILDIGIIRAGVICEWSGFIFLADVETWEGRECETIYWSDFNDPLAWIPGGESASGFISLSRGEKVLRMEPLAGQLRVYTINAIYNVTLVAGEQIFRFTEIYRGPDALAYRFAFTSLGESHIYLSTGGLVELTQFDPRPVRVPWAHKAGGVITQGLDGKLLHEYPGPFEGFLPLDRSRCDQITGGYDRCRREIWFSWPTLDKDENDIEGVRRMSLVLSRQYKHASLVDHGFSSFCNFVPRTIVSVKDWMVMMTGCPDVTLNEFAPPQCKEGPSFNQPPVPDKIPNSIYNPGEDTSKPPDADSICGLYGETDIIESCGPCEDPCRFSMASLRDLCLKEQRDELRLREVFTGPIT